MKVEFKNILIGCDFSVYSNRALDIGLSLAQEFESSLHLVHVIEPNTYLSAMFPEAAIEPIHSIPAEEIVQQLQMLVPEEAYQWCDVKLRSLAGRPFEELIKYADSNSVDLIILGVRGYGLMETMFLGATTDRVIRRSSCPVLSVSPAN